MRVVFMGTPDFAVGTLRALAEEGYEVVGVVTQPDKPKGRGKTLVPTPVKEEAEKWGIPVFQPKRVRDGEFIETLEALKPQVIVVVAFGQIIPREILEMPPWGCINVHASLLPKYRGAAPIQWAILDGEEKTGVTIMRMDEGLDTGDMITQAEVKIGVEETGGSLFDKLSLTGAKALTDTLKKLEEGTAQFVKQPAESPTPYAAMIEKKMGCIDWGREAVEIERLIRGLSPWPSAYTYLQGKMLKIWRAQVLREDAQGSPGTIAGADKEGIRVNTGKGVLRLTEVQLEGKKRMEAEVFLRGYHLPAGSSFTFEK